MRKKVIIIIIALLVVAGVGIGSVIAYQNIVSNRTSIGADFIMGNNDGSAKVFDTSGNGNDQTETGTLTFSNYSVDFPGTTGNYLSGTGTGIFNSANQSFAMKFTPDFASNDETYYVFFDGTENNRYGVHKGTFITNDGTMWILVGNTSIAMAYANWSPYWKQDEENILVYSGTSGNNNAWLNGTKIMDGNSTAWTPDNPTTLYIGISYANTSPFNGEIHYLKFWNRLLTADEVTAINADRKNPAMTATRTGLVGYWTMDANDINGTTVYDKSGQGNNGTSTASETAVAGKLKQAINFNGSTDKIDLGDASDLTGLGSSSFAISAWIKTNVQSTRMQIMSIGSTATNQGEWFFVNTSGQLESDLSDVVGPNSNILVNDDKWHHVAVVNNANTFQLYIDGKADGSSSVMNPNITSGNAMIGKSTDGAANDWYFNGDIDELRVYNRALLAGDVLNLYNATKNKFVKVAPKNGLVGYWNMDANDISGATIYDKSGNGNNGTISGAVIGSGKVKEALDFDGSNDSIVVTQSSAINLTANMTLSAWVYINGYGAGCTGDQEIIFKRDSGGTNYQFYYGGDTPGRTNKISYYDGTNTLISNDTVNQGVWNHVALTVDDAGNSGTIYINGVSSGSGTANIGGDSTPDLYIGLSYDVGQCSGQDYPFFGMIDEVRIYNRELSVAEMTQLYEATKINYIK